MEQENLSDRKQLCFPQRKCQFTRELVCSPPVLPPNYAMPFPTTIISGGQTGADRAALDFAMLHAIPHGGWCQKGRKALNGALDAKYRLKETPSDDYLQRTEWNVRDSDGTAVFTLADTGPAAPERPSRSPGSTRSRACACTGACPGPAGSWELLS